MPHAARGSVAAMELSIRAVGTEHVPEWLEFFDGRAFADNPSWAGCYCMAYLFEGEDWSTAVAEDNRADAIRLFDSGAATGLLATAGGVGVGWVRMGPKTSLPTLKRRPELASEDDGEVGSIVCFVVAEDSRRQGVGAALLDAAVGWMTAAGMAIAEAYPRTRPKTDAGAYRGPLAMYRTHGFTVTRDLGSVAVVRRPLH